MSVSILSPFRYRETPRDSIFMADKAFTGNASGKTSSQVSSESADAFQKKHGYSLGTVTGMSAASEEYGRHYVSNQAKVAARKGKAKG